MDAETEFGMAVPFDHPAKQIQTYAGAAKVYAGSEKTKIILSSGKSFIFPSRKYKIA